MELKNENNYNNILIRIFIIILILTLYCTGFPCYADESTSTGYTAAKDLSSNPTIYVETSERNGSDAVYFGAKNEPEDGVYVGVSILGGTLSGGGYGTINGDLIREGSLVSFYTELDNPYSLEYWSYLYGAYIGSERGLVVNMNFNFAGGDLKKVVQGVYDETLIRDMKYINTLSAPVYMRVGGEMTFDGISASEYKKAFRYIASLRSQYAPNLALVFSPNYSSSVGRDMDTFYPGDDVCDWVGASLYYNKYSLSGDMIRDSFYGVGLFGDAVLNAQQITNLSKLHNKPVMITEGGAAWYQHGQDVTSFAVDRVAKAMNYLTMVYPQIKAIVYSDNNFGCNDPKFSLTENESVKQAYLNALNSNPTYARTISEGHDGKGGYYTKIGADSGTWSGQVTMTGYTYSGYELSAEWYLDGEKESTRTSYPFRFTLNTAALDEGMHTVKVVFNSGASTSSSFRVISDPNAKRIFRDVMDPSLYFYNAVYKAVEQGIVRGTSERSFSPYEYVKRADFLCMMYRKAGSPEISGSLPFKDVEDSDYYAEAVRWAVKNGITLGKTADLFDPEGKVTRAEAVTFLWRYSGSQKVLSLISFKDLDTNAFYMDAVKWAVKNHIVNGISESLFAPQDLCIRGDAVCLLSRL